MSERLFVNPVSHLGEQVADSIDNAMRMFEMVDSLISYSNMKLEVRMGMIREGIRALVIAHNTLNRATGIAEDINAEGDFVAIQPYDLHRLLKDDWALGFRTQMRFASGAVNDPYLYASTDQPGMQIGTDLQQHAVLNVRKAQAVLANRLEYLMSSARE